MTTRVVLADDDELVRVGFRMILDASGVFEVVAEAANGRQAVAAATAYHPDVVVMDVRMPELDGIAATEAITRELPDVKVLILTTFDLDEYAFAGLRAGASGFLLKNAPPDELTAAIRTVAAGDAVVAPRVTRRLLEEFARRIPSTTPADRSDRLDRLTERELDVLRAVALGQSNQEIAATLFVSEATVKTHVSRLLAKLGLRDRVQAVIFAYDAKLVEPS
jgi:DNA-binding NarL/FixJ family response regulator